MKPALIWLAWAAINATSIAFYMALVHQPFI